MTQSKEVPERRVRTREMVDYTGADVGLQGIPRIEFLNPVSERLRFYYVALFAMVLAYMLFRRFVNSPTGRVCVAIRENEDRAQMLGYNSFTFKLAALMLASIISTPFRRTAVRFALEKVWARTPSGFVVLA